MPIAFATGATANNTTGTAVTGSLGTTVANQLIVLTIADDSSLTTAVTSVTDNKGNTYTRVPITGGVLTNSSSTQMWYAPTVSFGATHTVTVTWSTVSTGRLTIAAQYFNGFTGTPTFDVQVSAIGTSASANPGSTPTTTNANEVVVLGASHAGTASAFTLGAGYTNLSTVNQANAAVGQESKVVSATGAQSGTMTIAASRAWGAIIGTFYDQPVTPPTSITYITYRPPFLT